MVKTRNSKAIMAYSTNELATAVGQLLRRLRSETAPDELNLSQVDVLGRLDLYGPMTTAELARVASMKPQSMRTVLANLEQDGLVERMPHPSDGRQILFAMTGKGVDVRRKRGNAKREWLLAALMQLEPDEQRTVLDAIPLIKRLGEP
jgi:DNA-binding MarR family transcriptional regulator